MVMKSLAQATCKAKIGSTASWFYRFKFKTGQLPELGLWGVCLPMEGVPVLITQAVTGKKGRSILSLFK